MTPEGWASTAVRFALPPSSQPMPVLVMIRLDCGACGGLHSGDGTSWVTSAVASLPALLLASLPPTGTLMLAWLPISQICRPTGTIIAMFSGRLSPAPSGAAERSSEQSKPPPAGTQAQGAANKGAAPPADGSS